MWARERRASLATRRLLGNTLQESRLQMWKPRAGAQAVKRVEGEEGAFDRCFLF